MNISPDLAAKIVHAADCRCIDCRAKRDTAVRSERPTGADWITEVEFQQRVIDLAHSLGYKVAHFRTVRIARSNGSTYFATPVAADGEGFPDLILVGNGRIIAWELKVKPNKATKAQEEWISRFRAASAFDAAVYYPDDWPQIVAVLDWR